MSGVLLVSSAKLKAFSNINSDVDDALILSGIQIAQDLGLQNLLGTKFYFHILDAVQNSTLTTPENTLLQDYIQPYLLWRALWESLPTIWSRVMNKSVIIGNTEQGSAVDRGSMVYLRGIYEDRFGFYAQRLMDWIKNHPADYPDYFSYSSINGMPPQKENYFGGIHIEPGVRRLPNPDYVLPGVPQYYDRTGDYCCNDAY